jgi:hypothetical protein
MAGQRIFQERMTAAAVLRIVGQAAAISVWTFGVVIAVPGVFVRRVHSSRLRRLCHDLFCALVQKTSALKM